MRYAIATSTFKLNIAVGDKLSVIYVPKKLWSFGIHNKASPWAVSYQPFVYHRRRALITEKVHREISPWPEKNYASIPYSESCFVMHPTHASFDGFINAHIDYIYSEIASCNDLDELITKAQNNITNYNFAGVPELFWPIMRMEVLSLWYFAGCMGKKVV